MQVQRAMPLFAATLRLLAAFAAAAAAASTPGQAAACAASAGGSAAAGSCQNDVEGQRGEEDAVVAASSVQMLQQQLKLHDHSSTTAAGLAGDSSNSSADEDIALLQLKVSVAHPAGPPRTRGREQASSLLNPAPPSHSKGPKPTHFSARKGRKEPIILANNDGTSDTWCGYDMSHGFMTALTQQHNDQFMLDISDDLERFGVVRFMVTAMAVTGTYADSSGFLTEYASPQEDVVSTMFEMRIGSDNRSVDVYYPQTEIRTSDKQSNKALERGTGTGWYDTLSTFYCSASQANFHQRGIKAPSLRLTDKERAQVQRGEWTLYSQGTDGKEGALSFNSNGSGAQVRTLRPVVIDGGYLLQQGFYADQTVMSASSYRLLSVKSYPNNLDVTAEFILPDGFPLAVGFSLIRLRETPMTPRMADDRLLFFSQAFEDLGWHPAKVAELPNDAVDRKVEAIWRYDIDQLPDRQIKIYVDPTVPKRWRESFREGIEMWNQAYALIGRPNAVKGICPGDADWPADYAVADARFNTISWVISSQVVSMGIAKVDPRSGEILKSDITMSDGWVRSWLGDLDILAPNFTHQVDFSGGYHHETVLAAEQSQTYAGRAGKLRLHQEMQREALAAREGSGATAEWGQKVSLLSTAGGDPLSAEEMQRVLGTGLRQIVAHETGHILGLRHNFKGSMGISYECTRNASCTAVHGLSTSVMDYIPVNLPSLDDPAATVDYWSPVLGAYDKLAIRYGYMAASDSKPGHTLRLVPELRKVLEEAENYETCYDYDRDMEDPSCAAYDLTSEPLRYIEAQLDRLANVQRFLLNASVLPGASYKKYGESVLSVLSMAMGHGLDAAGWLGGVLNQYAYRNVDGTFPKTKVGREAVPAEAQRKAVELLLRVMRAKDNGLLPPDENAPFLIESVRGMRDTVVTLNIDSKVRTIIFNIMSKSLDSNMLARMHDYAKMAPALGGSQPLSVGEYLSLLVSGVLPQGLANASKSDWDIHAALVDGLTQVYKTSTSSTMPDEVRANVLSHLRNIYGETNTALDQAGSNSDQSAPLRDHLLAMQLQISSAVCHGGLQNCQALKAIALSESGAAPVAGVPFALLMVAAVVGLGPSVARAA